MEPDVLYVVRRGEGNAALRLSLRSLAHLPHRRVFIAGHTPQWVQGVTSIPVRARSDKFASIEANVRAGLGHPELGEDVIYMNDDFYFTAPLERMPITHGGPVSEYSGRQEMRRRMKHTVALLNHLDSKGAWLAYDGVHTPLPLRRDFAIKALELLPQRVRVKWRTWYGNLFSIGGDRVSDVKIRGPYTGDLPPFVSTNRAGLHAIRERLEEVIPSGSPYIASL